MTAINSGQKCFIMITFSAEYITQYKIAEGAHGLNKASLLDI